MVARKNDWLASWCKANFRPLGIVALILALFIFPLIFISIRSGIPINDFMGGFHWPAFFLAVWGEMTGICIIVWLIKIASKYFSSGQAPLAKLGRYAYAVYMFHPLVLVLLAVAVSLWQVSPSIKLMVVAPSAVIG